MSLEREKIAPTRQEAIALLDNMPDVKNDSQGRYFSFSANSRHIKTFLRNQDKKRIPHKTPNTHRQIRTGKNSVANRTVVTNRTVVS